MKINRIIAPGETIIYEPKLSKIAYFNLGRLIRNLTTTIFVSDKRFFHSHGWVHRHAHEIVMSKDCGDASSTTAPSRSRALVQAPSFCASSSAPSSSSARCAPSRAPALPLIHNSHPSSYVVPC